MKQNNNIENQFKQKLNQRNIEPSEKAWDRLDAMLSVSEQKKPKRNWLWMAASLLALITIGSVFFKTNSETVIISNDNNLVVEENPIEIKPEKTIEILSGISAEENSIVFSNEFKTQKIIQIDSFKRKNQTIITEQNFIENQTEIVQNTSESSEIQKPSNTYITAQDLLGSVDSERKKENFVAEQNIKSKVTVNHKSLLHQAEYEVENNYSKNAIDKFLHKSYNNVRVAISNRK